MHTEEKIILAADDFDKKGLFDLVEKIGKRIFCVKIHNLYDEFGPGIVSELKQAGAPRVWMDAKLHDIPNTVKLRAQAFAKAGCDIITAHASGGVEMMSAAKLGFGNGKVFAITALTSLDDESIKKIYNSKDAKELVSRLASMVKEAGIPGLVCSPGEIQMLRSDPVYKDLELAVPGIRSAGIDSHDQKRFDTPENAIKAGANYLVIGRQLTKAADLLGALDALENELAEALK